MKNKKSQISIPKVVAMILGVITLVGVIGLFFSIKHTAGAFNSTINQSNNDLINGLNQLGIFNIKNSKITALGHVTSKTVKGKDYYFSFTCNLVTASCDELNATIWNDKKQPLKCNGKDYTLFKNNTLFCCDNLNLCIKAFVDNNYGVHYNTFPIYIMNDIIHITPKETIMLKKDKDKYSIFLNGRGAPWVEKDGSGTTAPWNKYYNFLILNPTNEKIKCSANHVSHSKIYHFVCNSSLPFKVFVTNGYKGGGCDFRAEKGIPTQGH